MIPELLRSYPQWTRAHNLESISVSYLQRRGIHGILLDLDNTIVSEDDYYLSPRAEDWILQGKCQGLKFFLLSNGKRRHRVEYWSERLQIPAISPARKPLPFAFRKALNHLQLLPTQVIVIGDSFHTDVFGAWLMGCSVIQVASLPHPPRWWEQILGRWIQRPYPKNLELWTLNLEVKSY